MEAAVKCLLDYLNQVTDDPEHAKLDVQALPEGFRALGEGLSRFTGQVWETMVLAEAIAQGNLEVSLPKPENEIAAPLKSLHATLKHLTWQTQQVAKGDYQQRVDFMGDFSKAFNEMTWQLARRRTALLKELDHRRRENRSLIQNKSLYEQLVGQLEQWVVVADAGTGEWLFVSREAEEISANEAAIEKFRCWVAEHIKNSDSSGAVRTEELELTANGASRNYSVSFHTMRWAERTAVAFVLTDISRETESMKSLQDMVNHDPLTQRYNRRYGMQLLSEWLAQAKSFVLGFVDIDNLKGVNDQFGHIEGDRYIIQVSDILSEFSADAVICRIGGDEFMLLAQNWSFEDARVRMEQLKLSMAAYNGVSEPYYDHSISYGLIPVGADNILDASDLLRTADERMYLYKRAYKREMRIKHEREKELLAGEHSTRE